MTRRAGEARSMTGRARGAALAIALAAALGAPAQARALKLPAVREIHLRNGATLILAPKHDVPLIAFEAWLRGGSLTDPRGKEGAASLTAELLRKGAGKRTAQEIAATVDAAGARLTSGADLEATRASGEFLARDRALLVALLADLLRRPTFPQAEFEKAKAKAIEALAAAKDDPGSVIGDYAQAYYYGGHPYGRPSEGDEATLRGLTREDVLASYRANFGGDRLILAVVGDFNPDLLEREIKAALADWTKAPGPPAPVPPPAVREARRVLLVDKPGATQTYFWLVARGVSRKDPDRVALDVANTAFGGRFTSLLNSALRIESGLTYGARSLLIRRSEPGTVTLSSYTKGESTSRAVDLALATLAKFRAAGLDTATLTSAKTYISGQFPTRLETAGDLAARFAELAFHGLGRDEVERYEDRIGAVDAATAARTIARVYPRESSLAFVFVGDAGKIRRVVKKYGRVTEIKISDPLLTRLR